MMLARVQGPQPAFLCQKLRNQSWSQPYRGRLPSSFRCKNDKLFSRSCDNERSLPRDAFALPSLYPGGKSFA